MKRLEMARLIPENKREMESFNGKGLIWPGFTWHAEFYFVGFMESPKMKIHQFHKLSLQKLLLKEIY